MKQTDNRKARTTALSPVGRQIQEALATFLRRESSTIKPGHHLRADLGLDSLTTFELLYELEKAFDLEIPNEDLPGLQTLADIVGYVEARLRSSLPSATPVSNLSRSKEKARQRKAVTPATRQSTGKSKPQVAAKGKTPRSESITKKRAASAKPKGKKP